MTITQRIKTVCTVVITCNGLSSTVTHLMAHCKIIHRWNKKEEDDNDNEQKEQGQKEK